MLYRRWNGDSYIAITPIIAIGNWRDKPASTRTERRKGLLRYYGSDVWKGDLRSMRRNRD